MVVAGGTTRGQHYMKPHFSSSLNFRHVTKQAETVTTANPARARAWHSHDAGGDAGLARVHRGAREDVLDCLVR
jgi:hypothetical protein